MATESAALRYIETSAVLAALLENDDEAIAALRKPGIPVTSSLTIAEAYRGIIRARIARRITHADAEIMTAQVREFAARCSLFDITPRILARAGQPFPIEPVRTLDAIHLASLDAIANLDTMVTVVTRDRRVRDNASAMGHEVD